MTLNILWTFWVLQFAIFETLGYFRVCGMLPLTHFLRKYTENPKTGWFMAAAIGWLCYHLFIETLRSKPGP